VGGGFREDLSGEGFEDGEDEEAHVERVIVGVDGAKEGMLRFY
jgi:hypothetical protein